ncbi:MAG: GAP family protein [Acidimicrobiia bacterium]
MGELLSKVLPLSLGAAISPTVLAVVLVVLSGRRAVARGAAYVAGVLVILAGLTALGLYGVRQVTPSATTTYIERAIDAVAGVLLLLLALGTMLRAAARDAAAPPDEPTEAPTPEPDRRSGVGGAFVLGMAMMLSNFSTILLYLPAMHIVSTAEVTDRDKVLAVALAFVITSLPATMPLVVRIVAPGPASRAFGRLHEFISHNQRRIGVTIEVLFGVYLVIKALG